MPWSNVHLLEGTHLKKNWLYLLLSHQLSLAPQVGVGCCVGLWQAATAAVSSRGSTAPVFRRHCFVPAVHNLQLLQSFCFLFHSGLSLEVGGWYRGPICSWELLWSLLFTIWSALSLCVNHHPLCKILVWEVGELHWLIYVYKDIFLVDSLIMWSFRRIILINSALGFVNPFLGQIFNMRNAFSLTDLVLSPIRKRLVNLITFMTLLHPWVYLSFPVIITGHRVHRWIIWLMTSLPATYIAPLLTMKISQQRRSPLAISILFLCVLWPKYIVSS